MYKEVHEKGITREKSSDENKIIWIKCDKYFFNLQADLYIAAVYYPPSNSKYIERDNVFSKLQQDIYKYSNMGDIFVIGDLNSRIANTCENFIIHDPFHKTNDINEIETVERINLPKRTSQDLKINSHGRELIKVLNENKMVVLNGRKIGDTAGVLTCHQYNGSSIVDLAICNHDIYSNVSSFRVLPLPLYTDHCPIIATIRTNKINELNNKWDDTCVTKPPSKFIWNDIGATSFINKVNSKEVSCHLNKLKTLTDPDNIATSLEKILTDIAHSTLNKSNTKTYTNKSNKCNEWMTKELFEQRKVVIKARNSFQSQPFNLDRRSFFMNKRKKFKKCMYLTKKAFLEKDEQYRCLSI